MRKTAHKWFWAWDFDKEETWLNEMAAKGLVLVGIGFCKYTFDDCIPGEYMIRLELLNDIPTAAESQKYIEFIEDTGAEYLGSITKWVYFRRKTNGDKFDLYSDNASRIQHLNRILTILGMVSLLNISIGLMKFASYYITKLIPSLVLGILSLCLGLFIMQGFLKVYYKKRKLKIQQNIFE